MTSERPIQLAQSITSQSDHELHNIVKEILYFDSWVLPNFAVQKLQYYLGNLSNLYHTAFLHVLYISHQGCILFKDLLDSLG